MEGVARRQRSKRVSALFEKKKNFLVKKAPCHMWTLLKLIASLKEHHHMDPPLTGNN